MQYNEVEESQLVKFMLEDIKQTIICGISECPKNFKYTIWLLKSEREFDINLSSISEFAYERLVKEFISYLRSA